ncbi:MAG: DsbE family thiol:disulfide interchange protein [Gammaproteobacteria bacterium]
MARYLRYLVPLAIFALLVAFLYRGLSMDPKLVPSPLVGKPMPTFSLTRLDNPAVTISDTDFRGKVTLLNVWATWCVSCRREHETLVQLAKTGQVDIYGLNYKDNREEANRWLKRLGNPYVANAFDSDGRVGIDWGVYGAPETFIIDREGIIRHKHIGPLTIEIINDEILPLVAKLKS